MTHRVAVITVANSGIGLGMTRALLELGDRVAALDQANGRLESLRCNHDTLGVYGCNVTDREQALEVVAEVVQLWGRVDVVVNNACVCVFSPCVDRTSEDMRQESEVHYFGYLNIIDAVLPVMPRQGHGVIHNVSSGLGITG